jgi:UDP-N-acetylmuramoyl-tripeptide--D-alanyl-D-alanine ligase
MKSLSLENIASMCGGRLVSGDAAVCSANLTTDSRKVKTGDVFVALVGEKFDAHDFIPQIHEAGAAAVIVSRLPADPESLRCGVILVDDTLVALQNLAREHRKLLKSLIIGITGSNGKTSTKDMISAVMQKKFSVFATVGNLNNHIGVPLTLLSMDESHDCGIIEMGMNHFGEIKVLTDIALPDVGIITNIGIAHIEFLGSREGIALEKGTLAEAVPSTGTVILNANDDMSPGIAARSKGKVILAGVGAGDIRATILESSALGSRFLVNFADLEEVEVRLPVVGAHMAGNATLAAACGWSQGIPPQQIANALSEATLTKGRLQIRQWQGVTFLDDSYNANPDSMKAGLQTLADLSVPGRKIAVLGRMGELGPHAEAGHREVGEFAARSGLSALLTVGSEEADAIGRSAVKVSSDLPHQHFFDHRACAGHLRIWLQEGDAVLLKGSRSTAMEQVFTHLETA